jgi:hypothetical protein
MGLKMVVLQLAWLQYTTLHRSLILLHIVEAEALMGLILDYLWRISKCKRQPWKMEMVSPCGAKSGFAYSLGNHQHLGMLTAHWKRLCSGVSWYSSCVLCELELNKLIWITIPLILWLLWVIKSLISDPEVYSAGYCFWGGGGCTLASR